MPQQPTQRGSSAARPTANSHQATPRAKTDDTTDVKSEHQPQEGPQQGQQVRIQDKARGHIGKTGSRAMPGHKALSLEEAIRAYCDECRILGLKEATIVGYQRTLRCFLRWGSENNCVQVADLTAEAVKRYIAYLQHKPKWSDNPYIPTQGAMVSATTIRNYVRDLKAFASWLEREAYTPENTLKRVRKPKADEIAITPFSAEEIDAIFGALDLTDAFEFRDYVILHTLWDTGMRVGELVGLTLEDVRLKEAEMRIRHAKWGKWRDIGFGKQTQRYLSRYLSICRPTPALSGETHFFLSVDGYPLTISAVEQVCRRLSHKLGFRIHPHRFRHTFAVNMLKNGADIRSLQKLMGHASVQILMRYLNLASSDALEAHWVNSPADRHLAAKQAPGRRLPMRNARQLRLADSFADTADTGQNLHDLWAK